MNRSARFPDKQWSCSSGITWTHLEAAVKVGSPLYWCLCYLLAPVFKGYRLLSASQISSGSLSLAASNLEQMNNGILENGVPSLSLQCREDGRRWWSQRTLIGIYVTPCTWLWRTNFTVLWKILRLDCRNLIRCDFQKCRFALWPYQQWYIIWDKEGQAHSVWHCFVQ